MKYHGSRVWKIFLINALIFLCNVSYCISAAYELIVHVGHQRLLAVKELKRIAVGDPDILEISSIENGRGILLAGKKRGRTDLLIWEGNGHTQIDVVVREPSPPDDETGDAGLLKLLDGLGVKNPRITRVKDNTIVTGEGSDDVLLRANSLLAAMEDVLPALTREEYEKEEILYDLKFLETSKGSLKSVGIDWPDSIEIEGVVQKNRESSFVIESSFGILLKNLVSDGKAKILANPLLVSEEGAQSSFLAGGEIPVVIIGDEKREVVWKQYGIILNLENVLEKSGVIHTKLEAEVSTIDHASGAADIPGLITRRVKTSFSLNPGQTVVLSGLVKSDITKDVSKLPLLGHLPIIGELFKSRSFRNSHSELIITITPTILKAGKTRDYVEKFKKKYNEMDKSMKFNLLD